ncbi:MAG: type II toxin-antitoxin system VapC family toxin [Armatimonadota bacterium]|nr:type II toxin-antitoxin system VapC family toxin [Armatimonadota bacterium]
MTVLDTHVLIWHLLDDSKLDSSLRKTIVHEPETILVPTIAIWETLLLAQKGRIEIVAENPGAAIRIWVRASRFQEVPLTGEIALLSRTLQFDHDDPADRFIAATAHSLGAKLATSDERLRGLNWVDLAY